MNPKGQTQPQSIRPKTAPTKMRMPNIKKGKIPRAKNCPRAPIGQLKAASGHPQQFSTGKQTCFRVKK